MPHSPRKRTCPKVPIAVDPAKLTNLSPPKNYRKRQTGRLYDGWQNLFLRAFALGGALQRAAKVVGVSRDTVWRERKRNPRFDARIREIQERFEVATGSKNIRVSPLQKKRCHKSWRCYICGDHIKINSMAYGNTASCRICLPCVSFWSEHIKLLKGINLF